MIMEILEFIKSLGVLCLLPLGFGVLLLLMFIGYCLLFGWLEILPIFSGHFRLMSKVWSLGLRVVANKNVWKMAGIGVLFLLIALIFS